MFSAVLRRATSVTSRFTSHIPWLKNLRMNFVLIHYVYIIATSLLSSIIIYPGANLDYTDALFLSAGAATQSGLNTVDLNTLHTYQQIVLYVVSMLTTPIFIHTVLVFVRLYWFEKRFQHVVSDARALRHTRSRLRTISEDKDGQSSSREEAGVAGRSIVVLRDTLGHPGSRQQAKEKSGEDSPPASPTARDPPENLGEDASNALNQKLGIGLGNSLGNLRVPAQLSPEHHIAFLENQRRNKGALRIPSPREYDNGGAPQVLEEEEEEEELNRPVRTSSNSSSSERSPCDISKEDENDKDVDDEDDDKDEDRPRRLDGPHITINEPDMIRTRTRNSTFPRLDTRPTFRETKNDTDASQLGRLTSRRPTLHNLFRTLTQERERSTQPYLSWNATVGRNSNFVDLTEEQRDELGGIEYRALKTLAVVLISYYAFFHILGILCLVPWIMTTHWGKVVEEIGQGRPWWAIFMAQSAFNDVGFTLTPDSLSSFQRAIFPLLLMTFLIIIGNTGFPCMLRLIIWVLSKVTRAETPLWEELRFLLDHPRRCFTLLFPRNATWWLFAILVALNGIDLIFFIILDLNDSAVTSLPTGIRIVDGLFQAACTRTAGLAVISVSDLHPAVQVSYLIMMYISVFPIAISLRRTNVYEEKSLGIYASTEDDESDENQTPPSYIGAHLRKQLSFDLWYVFLGLFIITIVEGKRLQQQDEYSFQVWSVLFEVVSAYGTVGLSLGYPGVNASFSSQFQVLSKLVIIAMQIRGRHRGLPYALDRAILLPSESLNQNEIADAERRMRRRTSSLSQMSMDRQQSQGRPEHGASTSLDPKDRASQTWNNGDIIRRQSTIRSQRSQR